jgi:hypothetical protein
MPSAHTDGSKDDSLMHQLPFTPGRFQVLISVRGCVDLSVTVQLEGLGQFKIPLMSLGIEPMTFLMLHSSAECVNTSLFLLK